MARNIGPLDRRVMKNLINFRRKGGFTLIELLVVVLILAILMAVALPLYLSAVADAETKTCRANMQTIANAVQASRVKNRLADYSSFVGTVDAAFVTANIPDLQAAPICPTAGTYSIDLSPTPYSVNCSIAGHQQTDGFTPGVDGS